MHNCRYDPIKEYGLSWWRMWAYYSFAKRFLFEIPAFTKKVRILLKEPIFGFVGIQRVTPLVRAHGYLY